MIQLKLSKKIKNESIRNIVEDVLINNKSGIKNILENKDIFHSLDDEDKKTLVLIKETNQFFDLGLKETIETLLKEEEVIKTPFLFSVLTNFKKNYINTPEFYYFESFLNTLEKFKYLNEVDNSLKILKERIETINPNRISAFKWVYEIIMNEDSVHKKIINQKDLETLFEYVVLRNNYRANIIKILEKYNYILDVKNAIKIFTGIDDEYKILEHIENFTESDFEIKKEKTLIHKINENILFKLESGYYQLNTKTNDVNKINEHDVLNYYPDFYKTSEFLFKNISKLSDDGGFEMDVNLTPQTLLKVFESEEGLKFNLLYEDKKIDVKFNDLANIMVTDGPILKRISPEVLTEIKNILNHIKENRIGNLKGSLTIVKKGVFNGVPPTLNIFEMEIVKNGKNLTKLIFFIDGEKLKTSSISESREIILKQFGYDIGKLYKNALTEEEKILEKLEAIKYKYDKKIEELKNIKNKLIEKKEYFIKKSLLKEFEESIDSIDRLILDLKSSEKYKRVINEIQTIKELGISKFKQSEIKVGDVVRLLDESSAIGKIVKIFGNDVKVLLEDGKFKIYPKFLVSKLIDANRVNENFSFVVGDKYQIIVKEIKKDEEDDKENTSSNKENSQTNSKENKSEESSKANSSEKGSEKGSEKENEKEKEIEKEKGSESKSEEKGEEKESEEDLDDLLKI